MMIVTRRVVDPEVYDRACELAVCVDTFGGFGRAVRGSMTSPGTSTQKRSTSGMAATRAVTSVTRRGHRAWELERIKGPRPLMIVTHDRYELTDDGFTEIPNQYPKLDLDALVITNSSAQGFGDRVMRSAQQAGVPLYTLNDFIGEIRKPWT
jgi:hypothetical protein